MSDGDITLTEILEFAERKRGEDGGPMRGEYELVKDIGDLHGMIAYFDVLESYDETPNNVEKGDVLASSAVDVLLSLAFFADERGLDLEAELEERMTFINSLTDLAEMDGDELTEEQMEKVDELIGDGFKVDTDIEPMGPEDASPADELDYDPTD